MNSGVSILEAEPVTNGLHQVRLAQTYATIDEQRIVSLRGCISHCQTGRMGELAIFPDDKIIEGEPIKQVVVGRWTLNDLELASGSFSRSCRGALVSDLHVSTEVNFEGLLDLLRQKRAGNI